MDDKELEEIEEATSLILDTCDSPCDILKHVPALIEEIRRLQMEVKTHKNSSEAWFNLMTWLDEHPEHKAALDRMIEQEADPPRGTPFENFPKRPYEGAGYRTNEGERQ